MCTVFLNQIQFVEIGYSIEYCPLWVIAWGKCVITLFTNYVQTLLGSSFQCREKVITQVNEKDF